MIEAYAILTVFMVQILFVSVLHTGWVIRYFQGKLENHYADERYARIFPDWDRARMDRFLAGFRTVNIGIALLGVVPLFWLFDMMRSPDWDVWAVRRLITLYFMVQMAPFMVLAANRLWVALQARRRAPPEVKRTASLQRRQLFDFVSPATVFIAVLAYVLCAGLSLYFLQNPVPEISHPVRPLAMATEVYAIYAAVIYWMMYGKRVYRLDTHAERMREAALGIKAMFYVGIIIIAHVWFNLGLEVLHVERWIPISTSVNLMVMILVVSRCLTVPPRAPEAAGNLRQGAALS